MHILLTNDDGILAPGIAAIYRELAPIADVSVVAPSTVQSAAGHGITVRDPLSAQRIHVHGEFYGWAVEGRPADCVKLAVAELLEHPPDLVVSGINDGANVAVHVLYSGTVAAAAEGAILGIPSVAVSLEWGEEVNFARAATIARRLIEPYAESAVQGSPPCPLLNINIPNLTADRPRGMKIVPQAAQRVTEHYECTKDSDGALRYALRGWFDEVGIPDFDLGALSEGYVVLTPLHFDMTDHARFPALNQCAWPKVAD